MQLEKRVPPDQYLGEPVKVKFGTGEDKCIAEVVGYAAHPTYTLKSSEGRQFSWATHLCEPLSEAEKLKYWREKALRAEEKLERLSMNGEE